LNKDVGKLWGWLKLVSSHCMPLRRWGEKAGRCLRRTGWKQEGVGLPHPELYFIFCHVLATFQSIAHDHWFPCKVPVTPVVSRWQSNNNAYRHYCVDMLNAKVTPESPVRSIPSSCTHEWLVPMSQHA